MNLWTQNKTNLANVMLSISLKDFATIVVSKRNKNNGIVYYEIHFHIEDVLDEKIEAYQLDDVKEALETAKERIEDLYEDIPDYSPDDVNDWIEDFMEEVNAY